MSHKLIRDQELLLAEEPEGVCMMRIAQLRIIICVSWFIFGYCYIATAQQTSVLKRMFQQKATSQIAQLQNTHGPWLILAHTFAGDDCQAQAQVYAKELSEHFKLPAFIMERSTETQDVLGRGERIRTDELGRTNRKALEARFANVGPNLSYAVLLGEFHTKEDTRIAPLIRQVRQYQPKTKIPGFEARMAFLTRNPMLPDDYFESPTVDSFIEQLNRQDWIKYSLLDCPKRFTVRVASFRGADVVDVSTKVTSNVKEPSSALDRAASKANRLTEALRKRGVEAYQYHDRFGSYVTIGSFDSLGQEVNGQFQYDPRIVNTLNQFCGYQPIQTKDSSGASITKMSVKSETVITKNGSKGQIPMDVEGKPIAVPRVESGKIYGGSTFK